MKKVPYMLSTKDTSYIEDMFNWNITAYQKCEEYLKYDIKEIDYLIYYELIASGIKALSTPIIYLVCGIMIINGHMQIGGLMAILTYSTTMLSYFQNVI